MCTVFGKMHKTRLCWYVCCICKRLWDGASNWLFIFKGELYFNRLFFSYVAFVDLKGGLCQFEMNRRNVETKSICSLSSWCQRRWCLEAESFQWSSRAPLGRLVKEMLEKALFFCGESEPLWMNPVNNFIFLNSLARTNRKLESLKPNQTQENRDQQLWFSTCCGGTTCRTWRAWAGRELTLGRSFWLLKAPRLQCLHYKNKS